VEINGAAAEHQLATEEKLTVGVREMGEVDTFLRT
jgi:hypothetical protein